MNWPEQKTIIGHSAKHVLKKVTDACYHCIDSYYYRIIGDKDNIEAIDYDGGPFLMVGSSIEDLGTIESISNNGLIYFKNLDNVADVN